MKIRSLAVVALPLLALSACATANTECDKPADRRLTPRSCGAQAGNQDLPPPGVDLLRPVKRPLRPRLPIKEAPEERHNNDRTPGRDQGETGGQSETGGGGYTHSGGIRGY